MINEVLRNIYFKIYIFRYYSCLQAINDQFSEETKSEYIQKMKFFYSDLLRFPSIYFKNSQNIRLGDNELIQSFYTVSDNAVNNVYSSHIDLLFKIQKTIADRSANDLNNLSGEIKDFLDKLYNAVSYSQRITGRVKTAKRIKYTISVFIIIAVVLPCISLYSFLKEKYFEEKSQYDLIINEDVYKKKTIEDILILKEALQNYFNDNKSYPKSSGGWDAIVAPFGQSTKDWIPGLAPKYIKELPTDPRQSKDPMTQYMYKSDGTDFKLIAHFPVGMSEIINNHPELVDSVRPSWSFGVWSNGAKSW